LIVISLGGNPLQLKRLSTFVFTLLCPIVAWSQGSSTISGTVADPADAMIAAATVTVTESGTGLSRTVATGQDGYYQLSQLRPTDYALTVTAPGFRTYTQRGITLLVDQSLTLKVKLEIGATSEAITVTAAATQVNTTTGSIGQVVDSARMVELPLNGRNGGATDCAGRRCGECS
jgi:Carboxypeptidase regulatory-like domain